MDLAGGYRAVKARLANPNDHSLGQMVRKNATNPALGGTLLVSIMRNVRAGLSRRAVQWLFFASIHNQGVHCADPAQSILLLTTAKIHPITQRSYTGADK